ncbi:MAG TPA: sugar phosphate isomerase/epimerase family protein [Terriglobia bacterium]|nr:sugar phosphate isomerase/epimerase family protein [Terriglobia bacterium]
MKRRNFLTSAITGLGAAVASTRLAELIAASPAAAPAFTPCINQATTMKADFKTAMDAYSKAGFRVVELWLDSVEPFLAKESVATARRVIADGGLDPCGACCECEALFFRGLQDPERKWDAFRRKLQRSAELGAHRFVLCSGISEEVKPSDYEAAIPGLERVGELGRQFDIVVGLEFIRGARFLGCVETTANLLRRVNHPNVKVLIDTFHFHAGLSKVTDIEKLQPGEVSWVHINDVPPTVPRELLQDTDRTYVGDGVIPLARILAAISRVYQGPASFEVFQYADRDPYEVAKRGFDGLSRLLATV